MTEKEKKFIISPTKGGFYMTREQFDKYVASIRTCLSVFESQTIKNATIGLYLSDEQKKIYYSISNYNVAHLLGVKTDIIKEKCFLKKI